ncbi:MAG: CopG family transcriptional regulator [Phycisphaerae bacterium]|nr:CopG family transcriptional regulator [Phycisphaerae bacterium]
MIRTQVQLTEEQTQARKEMAHREQTSMAELIRQPIDRWLETAGPISPAERRRRALAAVGKFHSGKSDVSERHDEHLDEAFDQW